MPRVTSRINQVPNVMRTAAAELVKRSAESHVSISRQLAPVQTGFLRDNIHAEQRGPLTWDVKSDAPYSAFVEFEQPFFLPGYEAAQRQLRDEAQQVITAALAGIAVGAI